MRVDQIGLLLWKNYVVRKRQPGILALVFVWPVIVFMILYTIRDNVDPEYFPTCQFPARSMPRNGLLPFVQSFICSLGNPCDPLSEYEEVPSYKNATLGALITEIQPMLSNETVLSAVKTLPHSIQLLKSMAQILTKPEIKALFDRGIRLGDLFNNHEEIKRVLRSQMPDARRGLVDDLFDSSIKLVYLVEAFGTSNVGEVLCSPESLKKYLILPTDKDYVHVSKILCDIDSETMPSILENLSKHLDFSGMLKMVDRVMAKFRDYDIFVDLRRAVETILDLDTSKKLIPEYLRIRQWLPKTISMFKNVTFKEIDLTMVNKMLEILDPVFESEEDWPIARQAFLRLQNILALLKEMGVDQHSSFTGDFFDMLQRLVSSMQFLPSVPAESIEKLARIADAGFAILQSGAQLSSKILDRHKDDLQLPPEVWKGLKEFFSDRIIATLSYAFAFTQSVVRTVHHTAIIHEDLENRLYHVSLANKDVVQRLLTSVDPSAYRTVVRSFSRLDFVEKFVDAVTDAKPEDYFCRKDTLNEVFDDLKDSGQGAIASEILCSDKGKKFLSEVYGTMELQKFESTARDTLEAAMSMLFKQAIAIEKANLTGVVSSVNDFMSFMDKPRKSHPDWSVFTIDETWTKVFEDTKPRNRLNVLGLHLSIAKMIGCCNLSFQVIKSDMKSIDFIARMTLQDLTENKDDWVGEVTRRKYELLETFYLTATDRAKVLQILEYDNFTRSYCVDPSPPSLITFPRDTNSTLLKTLICRLASIVQNDLDSDIEMIRLSTAGTNFNWTAFNEITIGIYQHIDVLIHEKAAPHQLMNLEKLKKHFRASWSTDLSVRDGFEISVGLICKFFNLLESPLFNIQSKSGWKIMDSLGWIFTLIMDMLQNAFLEVSRVDSGRVNHTNDTLELPETRDLISVTLFNLRDLILDVIDIVTMKPIHLISLLDDYKTREDRWPCVQKESVGAALEFRSGSRAWIEKIENISCNPAPITREWRAYPTAYYLVHGSGETPPLKFNWTEGYRAVRNLTEQFENWVIVTEKSLSDSLGSSSTKPDVLGGLSNLKTIFDERWQNSEDDTNTVLNLIDMELDKTMPAFHSELRASDVWKEDVFIDDRVLITAKFASDVVHKVMTLVSSILRTDTAEYNVISDYSDSTTSSSESEFSKVVEMKWLPLLGFTNKSPIGILYNKLPYLLATLAEGLTDLDVDKLIEKSMSNEIDVSCDQLFDHWPTSSKVFTLEDHETLKKFACYLNFANFNAYTDLFMTEAEAWRTPANQYRSRVMSVISDAYDLSNILRNITKMRVMIEVPFSGHYFKWLLSEMLSTFEKSDKYYQNTTVQVPTDLTDYRLIVEGVSECLLHIANTVNKINDYHKLQKNRMNIWDFVQGTDVQRLLKILDAHPEETIALVAQMLEIGTRTGNFSYENIRKTICNTRSSAAYWSTPNRSRFVQQVCSFDPYQLLRSVTSEEYYMAVTVRRSSLKKLTPLNTSLGKLAEAMLSLLSNVPNLMLQSNILDQKTWSSLSNDTVSEIRSVGRSWVHWYATEAKNAKLGQSKLDRFFQTTDTFVKITRVYELLDASVDLMIGGDVWQKLRHHYEGSMVKPILTLIEDTPNIVVSIVDTFLKSDRLDQYLEKLATGKAHPCDLDKYLIVPGFVRKKVLLSSIANFCEKIVFSEKQLTWLDVLPLDAKYENSWLLSGTGEKEFNETFLLERVDRMQSTIIRIISEGPREPKCPIWWTSFKEGAFNDFLAHYKKEDPRALAHLTVKKLTKIALDILNFDTDSKDCSWCFSMFLIDVLNSQLENHRLYAELPCKMSQMNISEIQSVVLRDFHWNETTYKINNFRTLYSGRTQTEWMASMEKMLLHIVDMVVDFQNETYSNTIGECFRKFFGDPPMSRPGLYISVLLGILEKLQQNVYILDTSRYHKAIDVLSKKSAKFVPIWKDLKEVTIPKYAEDIESFLPGATINVNAILNDRDGSVCRTKAECRSAAVLQEHLGTKKAGKLFRYDPKAAAYPAPREIAERLSSSLDLDLISREVKLWRMDASLELTWLKEILRHLSAVIAEGRDLLDVASKIDFEDISNVLGVPDVIDGVLNILREKTVDKLFDGMREVIEDAKPFIEDPVMLDDIYKIISTLESMEIFKNLGLLNMKYVIKDMFDNWGVVSSYLNDKINVSNTVLSMLSEAKIDMISVFMKERKALSMKEIICSPKKLNEMLSFNDRITAEEVSSAVCQLEDAQTQNVTIALIKNMNFDYIFKTLMSANVKNILANANLTETEGRMVLSNLGVAAELIPFFKEKFASSMPKAESLKANVEREEDDQPMSTAKFLESSSKMLCGQAMVSDNGDLYKIISKIEDNSKEYDQAELDSLPTDFCRDTYKSFIKMGGGKIIWSYVKPLLRGQILYAPNTTVVNKVMALSNKTFVEMENFGVLMDSFVRTLSSLANLSDMSDNLKDLQDMMSSDVMKIAIKSLGGGSGATGDLSSMDFGEISWQLKKNKRMVKMIGMLNDLLECVLVDRVRGFRNEDEMEAEARMLMDTREFLAGVVFMDEGPMRSKRSLSEQLPENVVYKIRMDIDYVQSTTRLKNQFWIPGPESSFIEHLRYVRGFVQLQDSIDRAIIWEKSGKDLEWKTVTQQMPYPCWKQVPFQTTLYESQGIQVCFFFALMMCVGSAVRHIVWERESQNAMVMSVMGLKPWRNTVAWFITTYTEVMIVMVSIAMILLVGKILPKSDPLLVLVMMIDYAFSIVTFCYMISTMCSSASLSAITTVVMFLLTYMPYIIVIAMEAVLGLGYKLLICLSMSTSFCYGCLYAARKEVQGVGLSWSAMWEESAPGDSMSLGLTLLMIAFDGCLYATIGYFVARYTNTGEVEEKRWTSSLNDLGRPERNFYDPPAEPLEKRTSHSANNFPGRGFHDLRSRSLWWADTRSLYGRPSYLAFVNNLYFTNDVLHPSATYQDEETDSSSLVVNEKQTGVRFEGVRKVYNSDEGEVVAVDNFTLKMCEGEVTSLLGRNGAGKTTIIKMLTGMLAPTTGEICLNGEEDCKPDIGVCPQDNVLIGTLTPREHMIFYAKLKRPKENVNMQRNVDEMLTSLELGKQEHEPVYRLSGGTKRRLCVALAFLGSPKLVILDEPGAGVDPAARRRIWRLIDQHRIGRTVILSTHHLDEADMLSDTVVVMHKGKILCTGSPLSLKMMHGRGYRLLVSFPGEREGDTDVVEKKRLEDLKNVIEEVIPNAETSEIAGNEVVVTLPFQGQNGVHNNIGHAAKVLEDNRKVVGYSHFSLECDTLERVFLDLCSRAENGSTVIGASQDSVASVDYVGLSMPADDIDLIDDEPNLKPSPIRQAKALLKKRMWHFRKDWMTLFAGLFLPTIFVAAAMGFSLIRPPSQDEPALPLSPKLYDTHPTYFYSIDNNYDSFLQHVSLQLHDRFGDDYAGAWQTLPNDTGTCNCVDGQQVCHGVSQPVEGLLQVLPGRPTLDWIVSTHHTYIEKRYGGWSLSHLKDDPLFIIWFNNKGHHALPSYLSALNEAVLRASGVQGRLTTLNHPLKLSSDQLNRTTLLQHVADVGVALVLLIAFSLVAAQGSKELVRERLSEEKRILFLAGVHPVTYWTTALIWDFFVFGLSILLAVIVFEIFGLPAYVARHNLPGICLLLYLFAWAALPFSHLMEKIFNDSSLSNMVLFCTNTFIGVFSLATILVLDILGKTKATEDARNTLHQILLIFPQYALGDALVQISRNDITASLLEKFNMDTYQSPLGWDLLGLHFVFLAIVGTILFSLNLMIECRVLPTWNRRVSPHTIVDEDDDVSKERMRVESGMSEDILQAVKLRKEYTSVYGTNVAVQNLSIGVQAGKCFGLLGTNGAGKSSTFRMLTTEIIPTSGRIILKGQEVGKGPLCNGEIGYCPQGDGLDGFLSPHQCLTIHGEVCGLSNVPKAVELTLKRLDLLKYAHKRVSSLSGGNKRKLCTALSVMAPVSVVLMDEPTSGMDPATKDLVAKMIRRMTKSQSCVILTSHSVAECENLCNRVGILAKAGLRCIGTPQHLKHKFGEGYVAFLRFRQPVSAVELKKVLAKYLPQAVVSSRQGTAARLLLPRSQDMLLSVSFNKVKLLAEELKANDFTLTQSSLDQVLVNFSEEMDTETDGSIYSQDSVNNMLNSYSTADTIRMDTF